MTPRATTISAALILTAVALTGGVGPASPAQAADSPSLTPHAPAVAPLLPPFPVAVADPFTHELPEIEQPDGAGGWALVGGLVCAHQPMRLITPVTPEAATTAFHYRLVLGHGEQDVTSATTEFVDAAEAGLTPGSFFDFSHLADAARGPVVRLNFWSGSAGPTRSYYLADDC